MFYSNEVYLTNTQYCRILENGTRFPIHPLDVSDEDYDCRVKNNLDSLILGSSVPNFNMFRDVKSRLCKIVDVIGFDTYSDHLEDRPNLILETICSKGDTITILARAKDILYCNGIDAKLPTMAIIKKIPYRKGIDIYTVTNSVMEIRTNDIEDLTYYISTKYTDSTSVNTNVYIKLQKYWIDGKIIDRKDSRVSNRNRFYLNYRIQRVLHKSNNEEYNRAVFKDYVNCKHCKTLVPRLAGRTNYCRQCFNWVKMTCDICLVESRISSLQLSIDDNIDSGTQDILKEHGIEMSHPSCQSNFILQCSRCKCIEVGSLEKIHEIENIRDRERFIKNNANLSIKFQILEGSTLCIRCADLYLQNALYNPFRKRELRNLKITSKNFPRYVGIESEVITHYEDAEEYRDNAGIPENFEVVSDGSLNGGGVEFRTNCPIIGKEVPNSLRSLERVHREEDNYVDESCGIHIHINAIDFGFIELRNILMIMSSIQGSVKDSLPEDRKRNDFARDITLLPSEIALIPDLPSLVKKYYSMTYSRFNCERYNEARYIGTNLHARFYLGTIEFRYHEGEIEASLIQKWIMFLNSIMDASKDLHRNINLYKKILSPKTNAIDIINSIGGKDSVEYIEERIHNNR